MTTSRPAQGFDPRAPGFRADPYRHYRRLRSHGALQRVPGGPWLVGSLDLGMRVLRDRRFGHDDDGEPRRGAYPRSFLVLDPPAHTRLRRAVSTAFTPRLVNGLRPRVTAVVDDLLDRMDGDIDLLPALAQPLSLTVIGEVLGIPPRDRDRLARWAHACGPGLDPGALAPAERAEFARAKRGLAEYFRTLAARRRSSPGEDLLSALVTGGELDEPDLVATATLLFGAGYETTVHLVAGGMLALLRAPSQLAWFRDHRDEAPAVVEELLRYDPSFQFVKRVALDDVEVDGRSIRRGEAVAVGIGAANRDPEAFGDPDRLDVTRWACPAGQDAVAATTAPRHLAFGHGIHYCLGASLARLEAQTALSGLVRRDITLAPVPPRFHDNMVLRGLTGLPVRIGPGQR